MVLVAREKESNRGRERDGDTSLAICVTPEGTKNLMKKLIF